MKPADLKIPFTWNERTTLVNDRIWYVAPSHEGQSFQFPGWNHSDLFGNYQRVHLEYCSGNGTWIAAKARGDTSINWVGIEMRLMRTRKIWSKIKNHQIPNLLVVCGEALRTTQWYIPDASVDEVFINFPDPWPKRRHARFRLVQAPFVQEVWRILKPAGKLTIVTDDPVYSKQIVSVLLKNPGYSSCYGVPHYVTEYPDYGTSYFEDLWRGKGREIHYHIFQKNSYA